MQKRRFKAPSPALVVALIALFVALGGTSFAAITASLPKNSVGTKQLKNNAVTSKKIKNRAVTAAKIDTTGLTVPNADHATSATSAAPTGAAGGALAGTYPNPTLASIEAWHVVGTAGEPPFQNGWSNFGNGYAPMGFAKDSLGFVHLEGTIVAGTFLATVFTLPVGYRPAQDIFVPVAEQIGALINTAGDVWIEQEGSNPHAGLDGVAFKAGG